MICVYANARSKFNSGRIGIHNLNSLMTGSLGALRTFPMPNEKIPHKRVGLVS